MVFEFVAIAKETTEVVVLRSLRYDDPEESEYKEVIHTLLIETDSNNISQRIQVFSLDEIDWERASPKERTVYLT